MRRFTCLQEIVDQFNYHFERLGWNISACDSFDDELPCGGLREYSITFRAFIAAHEKEYLDPVLVILSSTIRKLKQLSEDLKIEIVHDAPDNTAAFYVYPKIMLTCKSGDVSKYIFDEAKNIFHDNCVVVIDKLSNIKKATGFLLDVTKHIYCQWQELYPNSSSCCEYKLYYSFLYFYLLLTLARFPANYRFSENKMVSSRFTGIIAPIIRDEYLLGDSNIHHYSFRYVDVDSLSPYIASWVDKMLLTFPPAKLVEGGDISKKIASIPEGEIDIDDIRSRFVKELALIEDLKQVIVVRKDLNMRKGKLAAQVAHASNAFLFSVIKDLSDSCRSADLHVMEEWIECGYTKIVVSVDSETELTDLIEKAPTLDILVYPIYDAGRTEFHGQSTLTCACFGPSPSAVLNRLTRHLKLL